MSDTFMADPMKILKTRYIGALKNKGSEIEEMVGDIAAGNATVETMKRMFYLSHNIVGLAPTHGFHQLANAAKRIEAVLIGPALNRHPLPNKADILPLADEMIAEIRCCLRDA